MTVDTSGTLERELSGSFEGPQETAGMEIHPCCPIEDVASASDKKPTGLFSLLYWT